VPPDAWSDLWSVFIPDGEARTFAEMTPEEFSVWRVGQASSFSASKQFAEWFSGRK